MKVGIIGLGVVGKAVYNVFKGKGADVIGYDIASVATVFEDLLHCEMLFLCLPSPTTKSEQNLSAIKYTLFKLEHLKYKGVVVIKSTVLPGTTEKSQESVSFDMAHNPEFLSAKTAEEDFRNQKSILIGSKRSAAIDKLKAFYEAIFPNVPMFISGSNETEMAKYMCNVSFAVKVGVFNEFYKVCQDMGIQYQDSIKMAVEATPWLSAMHTMVPGTDGHLGWGGMCFPKDVLAFLTLMQGNSVIKAALDQNVLLRPEEMKKYL